LRRQDIGCVITCRRDQGRYGPFDRPAYRQRNRVQRLINRLKHGRRVATRYEKRARNYLAFVARAAILLWL
jgi:transposase